MASMPKFRHSGEMVTALFNTFLQLMIWKAAGKIAGLTYKTDYIVTVEGDDSVVSTRN